MSISAQAIVELKQHNERYCAYNQSERRDCLFMEANGHPRAADYRKLRGFFDTLKYAANSRARYFSYK